MRVELSAPAPDERVTAGVLRLALERWGDVAALGPTGGRVDARLTIVAGDGAGPPVGRRPAGLDETVNVAGSTVDEAWFRVNAKLGRLSRSDDLLRAPLRLAPPTRLARRELATLLLGGALVRAETPLVDTAGCEARLGCRRCTAACPPGAAAVRDGGALAVDRDACTVCGACAAACPVGAINLPAFSDGAFAGLLDAIDESGAPQKTLVLTCCADAIAPEPWMAVEAVPDVGIVGLRWLAMAAASTLGAVGVLCVDGSCQGREQAGAAVEAISRVLGDRAPRMVYAEGPSGWGTVHGIHASGRGRPAPRAVNRRRGAWDRYAAAVEALASPGAPAAELGFSALAVSDGCTSCGACAAACPHGSIEAPEPGVLSFDAASCTGCGHCVRVCPERALTLSAAAGEIGTTLRPVVVHRDEVICCSACGAPLEAAALLRKVAPLIGSAGGAMRYCQECKQELLLGALPPRVVKPARASRAGGVPRGGGAGGVGGCPRAGSTA